MQISTPIWVYIVSSIFGILVLILITYAMYRVSHKEYQHPLVIYGIKNDINYLLSPLLFQYGFFKRTKREELVQLKRRSEAMANYQTEDED